MNFQNSFLDSIQEFYDYYMRTLSPDEDYIEHHTEEFNPTKYNLLVRNLLLSGLTFKVQNLSLLKPNEYDTYLSLVADRTSMTVDKMKSISEFLPVLYTVTKVMATFDKQDAANFMFLLNPRK